jgi:ribonuclease J
MARSKLDEHKLREVNLDVLPVGQVADAGPFGIELVHLTHSIPDAAGVALTCELGTILFTGDYKFDQTPVGGAPAGNSAAIASSVPVPNASGITSLPTS